MLHIPRQERVMLLLLISHHGGGRWVLLVARGSPVHMLLHILLLGVVSSIGVVCHALRAHLGLGWVHIHVLHVFVFSRLLVTLVVLGRPVIRLVIIAHFNSFI